MTYYTITSGTRDKMADGRQPIIHCVGDSHANFFTGYDEPQPEWPGSGIKHRYEFFRCYRIGPALAYNLREYNTTTNGREKLWTLIDLLERGSRLMFCFGEIDCRAHIALRAEKEGRTHEEVVRSVVDRYVSVILEVKRLGLIPLVWNVIPSAPTDINSRITVPPEHRFHGTASERNDITRRFNSYLRELVQREGIYFLDLFDDLFLADGTVDLSFYRDEIHLSQKAMPLVLARLRNDGFLG